MHINEPAYLKIVKEVQAAKASLIAVSKLKPVATIKILYDKGQRDFGENYVQELVDKQAKLPADIRWHFIGHLQSNKVKFIAPFIYLVQGVDSFKLLKEINRQAAKQKRIIKVLLQVHIAREETKFGLSESELVDILSDDNSELVNLKNILIAGLMGLASFSDNKETVRTEFQKLQTLYDRFQTFKKDNVNFSFLSMGMSGDYAMALEEGSNMIRVGSLIFGNR